MIPYKGYVEANLIIPGLLWYNKDVLSLVILENKYGERVPVQIGTLVIDHLVATMTAEELQQAGDTWKQVHLGTVISKRNTVESHNMPMFDLEGVKGKICMMREVVIPPWVTIMVKAVAKLMTHSKQVNVVIMLNCRLFEPLCHGQILWCIETGNKQSKCLPRKSQCKANHSPSVDYCGRDCSGKCHSDSVGTEANRG